MIKIWFNKNIEATFLGLLGILSFFPRFLGLGYSHFYGDETKILYLDKTVPAAQFFLNQRKGPIQFLVAWVLEKFSGGHSEFWIRLPFAVAGFLSIFAFYFLTRKLFGKHVAMLASLLYSFSGFSIAFSRTAQYQSFLQLFGFLALLFFVNYVEFKRSAYLTLSAAFYILAFYCHYDAIFYFIPVIALIEKKDIRAVLLQFFLPIIAMLSLFYIPYIYLGFFKSNTLGYLSRRVVGSAESLPNNSLYTFLIYNPLKTHLVLLLTGFVGFITAVKNKFLYFWFLPPFILFTFIFSSPGTHILNFLIPVYIMSALGLTKFNKKYCLSAVYFVIFLQIATMFYIFVPVFNSNYPWKAGDITRKYQLFLYGFPYSRKWDEVGIYLNNISGARNFYTNDNTVVAKYYVSKLDLTPVAPNYLPRYYVYIKNNQELKYPDDTFLSNYTSVKSFGADTTVYKLKILFAPSH